MEERRPAHLGVADVLARLVLDHVERDPLERVGVLHEGDREVERGEQLGLVGDLVRRHEDVAHPGERVGRIHLSGAGDLQRRFDPERAIEVQVELRLGHRAHERAQGPLVERHAAMVAAVARGWRILAHPV